MYVHIYAKHISFASSFSVHSYAAHTTQYTLNCGVVSLLEIAKHSLNIIKSIWYRNSTPENRQTLAKPIDRAQNPILFNSRESERKIDNFFQEKKENKKWKWPRNVLCEWCSGKFAVQDRKNWNCRFDSRTMMIEQWKCRKNLEKKTEHFKSQVKIHEE